MKKALIIYQSRKGTTRKYGEAIATELETQGLRTIVKSINEVDEDKPVDADFVFLGCWTSGLFICMQHPDKSWTNFAKKLLIPNGTRVGLFTTYKLATGSMFTNMKKHIATNEPAELELKSKNASLSQSDKKRLQFFIS